MADEDGRRRLGRVVARAREALGLDRKDLAARSGLSYPYVAQIENGDREPSLKALQALSVALELGLQDLTTALEYDGGAPTAPRSASLPSPRFMPNPGFAAASPAPDAVSISSSAGSSSLRRTRGSSARRAVVAELHELLEQLDPEERLTVLGELQGLVLADLVRHEVRQR